MVRWPRKRREESPEPEASTSETSRSEQKKSNLKAKLNDKNRWYWKFAQQNLPGWAPILTANGVVLYFFCFSLFCIAIGVPVLIAALEVKEYSVRYDNQGPFAGLSHDASRNTLYQQSGNGLPLTVSLTVTDTMKPPVYVFYELHKYYQNHKRYVRSRSDNQMGGKSGSSSSCNPQQYVNGSTNAALPNGGQIDPCGLIAWSFFNDTYSASIVSSGTLQPLSIDESGIAWAYDKNHLYGNVQPVNYNTFPEKRGGNTSDVPIKQNEHLIVWLRPAAQPSFRKLWGRIDQTLAAGTIIQINVQNRYDTYRWGGEKRFVLSTNSWVGGRNMFLGVIYLVVAGLAMLSCLAFLCCYHLGLVGRREFGDLNHLSWQRRQ